MKRFANWIWRQLRHLVAGAWRFWLAILVPTILCLITIPNGEAWVRVAGLALQVLGLLIVARGLEQARALYDRPSLLSSAQSFFRDWPRLGRSTHVSVGTAPLKVSGMNVRVKIGSKVPQRVTVKQLRDLVEQKFNQINERVDHVEESVEKEAVYRSSALDAEKQARECEDALIKKKLEELMVGSIHLDRTGVLWLAIGIVLTSIPQELIKLVQR